MRDDPYESSDAVFGVKSTLVVDVQKVTDETMASKYDVKLGSSFLEYNFVLVTEAEALDLRQKRAAEAMNAQGRKVVFLEGLPVPELD